MCKAVSCYEQKRFGLIALKHGCMGQVLSYEDSFNRNFFCFRGTYKMYKAKENKELTNSRTKQANDIARMLP